MPNPLIEEKLLERFLIQMSEQVFVKSTNSVTFEEEELHAKVRDMEAVIELRGEWDREDLKKILTSLYSAGYEKALEDVERIANGSVAYIDKGEFIRHIASLKQQPL